MQENNKAVLTEEEFCQAVNISRVKAWALRKAGKLPHCKVGTRILYKPEHIQQFLDAHERPITANPQQKFNPITKRK